MAWIESHQNLPGHPKTKKLKRILKISTVAAVGHLHLLWWWALDHAQDGELSKYDPDDIADACEWDGDPKEFCEALRNAGFVDFDGEKSVIHDWWNYAGKLVELRRKDRERKRKGKDDLKESDGIPAEFPWKSDGVQEDSIRNPNPNPNQKDKKTLSSKTVVYDADHPAMILAEYLLKKIREHSPDVKSPKLQTWANDMRLMIERDKRDKREVSEVIKWATSDDFWKANILSVSKLREKYDTLRIAMNRGTNKAAGGRSTNMEEILRRLEE